MISRLPGAIARAILVVLLIATPSVMLPGVAENTAQTVVFVSILAAALVLVEYGASAPSLVEFRDAPPFNRIRFVALFATVGLLTVVSSANPSTSQTTEVIAAIGRLIGHSIDFPYSPVRLVVLMLPEDSSAQLVSDVRTAAGLSYIISLLSLAVFLLALRFNRWPARSGAFNVWINLPTFDPTGRGDVVDRLNRDAKVNLILGFLLPFLIPALVRLTSDFVNPIGLDNPQTVIWTMAAWAFLPASLFMRGIAMARVAQLIQQQRRRAYAKAANSGMLAA